MAMMDPGESPKGISTTRLYGSAIAIVSGVYSLLASAGGGMMSGSMMGTTTSLSGWLMLVLGLVVLVHGVVLLTPAAARIGTASGPLMIGYAVLMLANQAVLGVWSGSRMGSGMEMMGDSMVAGMGWDAGMIALAALMLASGLIMTARN